MISINGRDIIVGTEEELQELTTTLERRTRDYGLQISAEKSKIMINSRLTPKTTILMNGERFEEVTSFKYLLSIISSEGDSTEKNTHTDKPGNINDSKTQEDMEQQQHQNGNKDTTL